MFVVTIAVANIHYLFNPNEFKLGVGQSVDHTIGVWDVLATMWTTPSLFKTLTNFTLQKFEELVALVVPTIDTHVQSTNDAHIVCGRPTKLTLEQQLLQFILYMKHDNAVMFCIYVELEQK